MSERTTFADDSFTLSIIQGGDPCEIEVRGYDYGNKPLWIPATFVRRTPRMIVVKFRIKSGRELVRHLLIRHVRPALWEKAR